jgi:hypothetical protein
MARLIPHLRARSLPSTNGAMAPSGAAIMAPSPGVTNSRIRGVDSSLEATRTLAAVAGFVFSSWHGSRGHPGSRRRSRDGPATLCFAPAGHRYGECLAASFSSEPMPPMVPLRSWAYTYGQTPHRPMALALLSLDLRKVTYRSTNEPRGVSAKGGTNLARLCRRAGEDPVLEPAEPLTCLHLNAGFCVWSFIRPISA